MKGKNCLIFGGSGQIGRHLIRKLTQNDYRVTVVTRNIHQKGHIIKTQGNVGYIDIVEANISDEAKIILDSLRKKGECDLNLFKTEFDFSNKKWDKITKELRGKDLIIIYKIDENLFIKPS